MQKLFHFKISNIFNNEMLLAFYMFIFPAFSRFYDNRSRITWMFVALILASSILINYKSIVLIKRWFLNIVAVFAILFLITAMFNNNKMLPQYFREFILFGVITCYLFSRMRDYNKFLLFSALWYVLLLAVSFRDPFNGYIHYSGYMSFGLFCILPCFCCSIYRENIIIEFFYYSRTNVFGRSIVCKSQYDSYLYFGCYGF